MASKRNRLVVYERDGGVVLDFGAMHIWDGADLSLLRETLAQVIEVEGYRHVGIAMDHVQYVPSGFFGMLYDWHEKEDVDMYLYAVQGNVNNMLWFQQFFDVVDDDRHILRVEPKSVPVPVNVTTWKKPPWQTTSPAVTDASVTDAVFTEDSAHVAAGARK
jgi:hypothetical protein